MSCRPPPCTLPRIDREAAHAPVRSRARPALARRSRNSLEVVMPVTVLVVDDSLMVRRQVSAALTAAGFRIIEASDGADALVMLDANPDAALVVCDVNMPRMNGLELLEAARPLRPTLPFLMLTAEAPSAARAGVAEI
jgi:CheY-like chemotaxis protein